MVRNGLLVFVPLCTIAGWQFLAAYGPRRFWHALVITLGSTVAFGATERAALKAAGVSLPFVALVTAGILAVMVPLLIVFTTSIGRYRPTRLHILGAIMGGIIGAYVVSFGILALGCSVQPGGCDTV